MRRAIDGLFFLLLLSCSAVQAQITGGIWISSTSFGTGTSCTDDKADARAFCEVTAYCTRPPNAADEIVFQSEANAQVRHLRC